MSRAKPKGGDAPRMWPAKVGLFLLRVFTGGLFIDAIYYKLWVTRIQGLDLSLFDAFAHFVENDYKPLIRHAIQHPPEVFGYPIGGFSVFLENVMLPGAVPDFAGPAILVFELLLGVSLVFGVGVRLMAFLGALLMLTFGLSKNMYLLTITGTNWMLFFVLLFFALAGAGRVWGFDARLRHRWPGWIS